jgi:alanine dehydrogenase
MRPWSRSTCASAQKRPNPPEPPRYAALTLLIDNEVVRRVLAPAAVRRALESAYRDLAAGEAVCRPRIDVRIPTKDPDKVYQWGTMEGGSTGGYFAIRMKSDIVYERDYAGVRTQEKYCTRPGRYCGLILLTDVESGEPLAIINDGYLQHLRVAADSAIGASLMAREDSRTLGMLGSGGMARSHVEALLEVRQIERIKLFSPTAANRRRFASELTQKYAIPCDACDDPREVYRGADILAACTDSAVPVIRGEWLESGMHVISIGGRPDEAALARFDRTLRLGTTPAPVGRPELATADEYLGYIARPQDPRWKAVRGGRRAPEVTGRGRDVSFGEIADGKIRGRTSREQITYSERGNIQGAQFFAVAAVAYEAARRQGLGRDLPTEWFLQDIRD